MFHHRRRRAPGRPVETDQEQSTNRSSRARRQGVARLATIGGEREARHVRCVRHGKSAGWRSSRPAWTRAPRAPGPRSARSGWAPHLGGRRVSAVRVHRVRRDPDRGAARRRAATPLRVRSDRARVDVVAAREGTRCRGSTSGVCMADQLRGAVAVAGVAAVGASGACSARRRKSVARCGGGEMGADRGWPRAAFRAFTRAVGAGIRRRKRHAVMGIAVRLDGVDEPTTLDPRSRMGARGT